MSRASIRGAIAVLMLGFFTCAASAEGLHGAGDRLGRRPAPTPNMAMQNVYECTLYLYVQYDASGNVTNYWY